MADFLFSPVPHDEAIDFIASKPVVSRAVFDGLLPELRARAFTITGVDAASTVQAIRDRIADLPAGATWDAVKKDIARQISPHFIDPDADAEEHDKQVNASNRRAELLLRTHGFQAYQTASYQRMNDQKDVLPYWQYVTMGDGRVRPSHAALNGVVLPASSPFWGTHFPPWDYGCRCQCLPISKEEHDDIKAEDANKPGDQQRVLDGPLLTELEQNNRLVRGPNQIANVAPPSGPGAFHWHPGDRDLSVADLRSRYDSDIFDDFEQWARKTDVEKGRSVWDWIDGNSKAPAGPGAQPSNVPPTPPVASSPPPKPTVPSTVAELLRHAGLDQSTPATAAQMQLLQSGLIKASPAQASSLLWRIDIDRPNLYRQITPDRVRAVAQGFIDMLPLPTAGTMPAFELQVRRSIPGATPSALGDYNKATKVLRLNGGALDHDPAALQKTAWHEMIHWAHDHGPAAFRARVETLFAARTNQFRDTKARLRPFNSSKITGFDDDFFDANGDEYAGRVYPWETGTPFGYEIATRHLEKLALPAAELARHWNYQSSKTGRYSWREAFIECLHMFFLPTMPAAPKTIP